MLEDFCNYWTKWYLPHLHHYHFLPGQTEKSHHHHHWNCHHHRLTKKRAVINYLKLRNKIKRRKGGGGGGEERSKTNWYQLHFHLKLLADQWFILWFIIFKKYKICCDNPSCCDNHQRQLWKLDHLSRNQTAAHGWKYATESL